MPLAVFSGCREDQVVCEVKRDFPDAFQRIYWFGNGYGASIVSGCYTYGGERGLLEVAVLKFPSKSNEIFSLCYSSPITNDVIGYCSPDKVNELLSRIEALPPVVA